MKRILPFFLLLFFIPVTSAPAVIENEQLWVYGNKPHDQHEKFYVYDLDGTLINTLRGNAQQSSQTSPTGKLWKQQNGVISEIDSAGVHSTIHAHSLEQIQDFYVDLDQSIFLVTFDGLDQIILNGDGSFMRKSLFIDNPSDTNFFGPIAKTALNEVFLMSGSLTPGASDLYSYDIDGDALSFLHTYLGGAGALTAVGNDVYVTVNSDAIHKLEDGIPPGAPFGPSFGNLGDMAADSSGNIYVVDFIGPVIWKIDPDGNATLFSNAFNGILWLSVTYIDAEPPENAAPEVNAGSGDTISFPTNVVALNGSVTDDGLPDNNLIILWSKTSGPGNVVFGDVHSAVTTATFFIPGTYVLRLEGDDGALSSFSEVTFIVNAAPAGPVHDTLASVADTFVRKDRTAVFGSATNFTAKNQGGNTRYGYLKLDTSGILGTITQATLRLTLREISDWPEAGTGLIREFTDNAWDESINWFSRPDDGAEGAILRSIGLPVTEGDVVDIDVTDYVNARRGAGVNVISFASRVQNPGNSGLKIYSRESSFPPELIVTYDEAPGVNHAPDVDAGAGASVTWPVDTVELAGTVTDDGRLTGDLTIMWSKVSGAGDVVFESPDLPETSATFSLPDTYVLRLEADDGTLSNSSEVTVTIESPDPGFVDAQVASAKALLGTGDTQGAQAAFAGVLPIAPDHAEAHFYMAVTRIVNAYEGNPAAFNLLLQLGLRGPNGNPILPGEVSIFSFLGDVPHRVGARGLDFAEDSPNLEDLKAYAESEFRPAVEAAFENLAKVTPGFVSFLDVPGFLFFNVQIEFDDSDVLMAYVELHALRAGLHASDIYRLEGDIQDLYKRGHDGTLDFRSDAVNMDPAMFELIQPSAGEDMVGEMIEAINFYLAASDAIRAEVDPQENDFLYFDPTDLNAEAEELKFRNIMTELRASLDPVTYGGAFPAGEVHLKDIFLWGDFFGNPIDVRSFRYADNIIDYAAGPLRLKSQHVLDRLAGFDAAFNQMILPADFGFPLPIEMDWSDVLFMRTAMTAYQGIVDGAPAYEHNLDLAEGVARIFEGTLNWTAVLAADYPNFGLLLNGAPVTAAKADFLNAANMHFAASDALRAEVDDQSDDLIPLKGNFIEMETRFRDLLVTLSGLSGTVNVVSSGTPYPVDFDLNPLFDTPFDIKPLFPVFAGAYYVPGTFPDPTFNGLLPTTTNDDLSDFFGTPD